MLLIYSIASPSHRHFVDRWFIPTLAEPCEVRIQLCPQICAMGEFLGDGWSAMMLEKVDLILRAIDESWGDAFLYADADVQFFRPFESIFRERLAGRDMAFQLDSPQGHVCAGFFGASANVRTREVWREVRARLCSELSKEGHDPLFSDQTALNDLLGLPSEFSGSEDRANTDWSYFPPEIVYSVGAHSGIEWQPADPIDLPPGIGVHHANWTVGLKNKSFLLKAVRAHAVGSAQPPASKRDDVKVVCSTRAHFG